VTAHKFLNPPKVGYTDLLAMRQVKVTLFPGSVISTGCRRSYRIHTVDDGNGAHALRQAGWLLR